MNKLILLNKMAADMAAPIFLAESISILIDFSFVSSHLIGLAALVSLFLFVSTINTSMYLNFQTRGGAKTITYQYGYPLITCRTINSSVRNLDHVQCNMQEYNMVMQTHQM